jgi:hypothetical protein
MADNRQLPTGSRTVKIEPSPGTLCTSMRSLVHLHDLAGDRQAQAGPDIGLIRMKRLKDRTSVSSMPLPLSLTRSMTLSFACAIQFGMHGHSARFADGTASMAFITRFITTSCIWSGSTEPPIRATSSSTWSVSTDLPLFGLRAKQVDHRLGQTVELARLSTAAAPPG